LNLQQGNFSKMIESYLLQEREKFLNIGDLSWNIEPGLTAQFETDAFETVMRNLLENASLYTDQPATVTVKLARDGEMAHLSFTDQGYGIPAKYRKKVFRIFYRIRHSGKTIRGSGIGLFIVRNVIRLHGGKAWIESLGSGKGTTFHLMIPLSGKAEG
jgi:signal transduction histidine kinase